MWDMIIFLILNNGVDLDYKLKTEAQSHCLWIYLFCSILFGLPKCFLFQETEEYESEKGMYIGMLIWNTNMYSFVFTAGGHCHKVLIEPMIYYIWW